MLDYNINVILYNMFIALGKELNVFIKELSCQTGASIRSVRYYEAKGLIHAECLANGYRDYDDSAIARVKTIQLYLGLGLTTDDIVQIIDCPILQTNNKPMCKEAYKLYKARLDEVNEQIEILHTIQSKLRERIEQMEE
ncbi:MAG: putative transcriptional regulator [Firmicutes bacterium]|nr:putative transcriptional regulator [Bacillota bacterium]